MSRKGSAAAQFEARLLALARDLPALLADPATGPVRGLVYLLGHAYSEDPHWAEPAWTIMGELHLVFEYVRNTDDNWRLAKRQSLVPGAPFRISPKRTLALKPEHVPSRLSHVTNLANDLWPVMPLVSFLYFTRMRTDWTWEEKVARLFECAFVLMATKPTTMRPYLSALTLDVVAGLKSRRWKTLDEVDVADRVEEMLARRPAPVRRYRARARSVEEAARNVRLYMVGAIRRRTNDVLRAVADPEVTVPASTLRRWRAKHGFSPHGPADAEEIRRQMDAKKRHVERDRVSLNGLAKAIGCSRAKAKALLKRAEAGGMMTASRGPIAKDAKPGTWPTIMVTRSDAIILREMLRKECRERARRRRR